MKFSLIFFLFFSSVCVFANSSGPESHLDENFDRCYELKEREVNSSTAVDQCLSDSKNFDFLDNPNFDKCYKLKERGINSASAVDQCMDNSKNYNFLNNPGFDKCYKLKARGINSASAVDQCMKRAPSSGEEEEEEPSRPDADGKVLRLLGISNFRKVSTEQEIESLSKALIVANGGYSQYGTCKIRLNWSVRNKEVRVYTSENSVEPFIVYVSEEREAWVKISVDVNQKKITQVVLGYYKWVDYNEGTISSPIYTKRPEITESEDANGCSMPTS